VLVSHGQAFIAFIPRLSGLIALIDRAATKPAQVPDTVLQAAADTGVFSNPATSGFQAGHYPLPSDIERLFVGLGLTLRRHVVTEIDRQRSRPSDGATRAGRDGRGRTFGSRAVSPARDHCHLRTRSAGGEEISMSGFVDRRSSQVPAGRQSVADSLDPRRVGTPAVSGEPYLLGLNV